MIQEIILMTTSRTLLLIISIVWVILSIVILINTFFFNKGEEKGDRAKESNENDNNPPEAKIWFEDLKNQQEERRENNKKLVNFANDVKPTKLANMLTTFKTPSELKLLNETETELINKRTYTSTEKNKAEAIGSAFADELERIGFTIEPVDYNHAKAVKDNQIIHMTINSNSDLNKNNNDQVEVVIEIWTEIN